VTQTMKREFRSVRMQAATVVLFVKSRGVIVGSRQNLNPSLARNTPTPTVQTQEPEEESSAMLTKDA
jgi:hypothetical protein